MGSVYRSGLITLAVVAMTGNAACTEAHAADVAAFDAAALRATDESGTSRDSAAYRRTATTGCDCPAGKRGRFSNLPSGSVPRVL